MSSRLKTFEALKAEHDKLLSEKPEDIDHVEDDCVFCAAVALTASLIEDDPTNQGSSQMADFSKDQVDSLIADAVAKATEPLLAKVAELEKAGDVAGLEKAMAEAIAPFEAKVADLQVELDKATAAKTAAETELAEAKTAHEAEMKAIADYLDAVAAENLAEWTKAERTSEREKVLTDSKLFDEKYIEANLDRLSEKDDDDFKAWLVDMQVAAGQKPDDGKGIPAVTALTASRVTATDHKGAGSALGHIGAMRRSNQSPKSA